MALDTPTLYVLSVSASGIAAVLVWVFGRRTPSATGAAAWAGALLLYSLQFLAVFGRPGLPEIVGVTLANALGIGALAAFHQGACQIRGDRFPGRAHGLVLVAASLLILLFFQEAADGYRSRVVLMGVITTVQSLAIARTLAGSGTPLAPGEVHAHRFAATAFGALALLQATRALTHMTTLVLPGSSILASDFVSQVAGAVFLAFSVVAPFLLVYMNDARVRCRLARTNEDLQQSLDQVRTLRGLLPVCAWCKRVRDEAGAWARLEEYLASHTEAAVTHGICPSCVRTQFPEIPDAHDLEPAMDPSVPPPVPDRG